MTVPFPVTLFTSHDYVESIYMFCFVIVCFSVLTIEPNESRGFNLIKLRAYLFCYTTNEVSKNGIIPCKYCCYEITEHNNLFTTQIWLNLFMKKRYQNFLNYLYVCIKRDIKVRRRIKGV